VAALIRTASQLSVIASPFCCSCQLRLWSRSRRITSYCIIQADTPGCNSRERRTIFFGHSRVQYESAKYFPLTNDVDAWRSGASTT